MPNDDIGIAIIDISYDLPGLGSAELIQTSTTHICSLPS